MIGMLMLAVLGGSLASPDTEAAPETVELRAVYCLNFLSALPTPTTVMPAFQQSYAEHARAIERLRTYSITHVGYADLLSMEAAAGRGRKDATDWIAAGQKCFTEANSGAISAVQFEQCGGSLRLISPECTKADFLPF